MSISAVRKQELIKEYATKAEDTGSPEVQVAILTERISNLTEHFKTHKKQKNITATSSYLVPYFKHHQNLHMANQLGDVERAE